MNRRILSFIMAMVMVCAMAAGCGKKEDVTEKNEEPKQEETKKDDAKEVVDEKAVEPAATEAKDTNKTKLDDADVEALKASIADSIKKEYLEPNNIAAEEFSWPELDHGCWMYLRFLQEAYISEKFMGITEGTDIYDVPSSPYKEIIDVAFEGMIDWFESSGVDKFEYFDDAMGILQPDVITSIDVVAAK